MEKGCLRRIWKAGDAEHPRLQAVPGQKLLPLPSVETVKPEKGRAAFLVQQLKSGLEEVDASVNPILEREEATFVNLWDNLTLKQKRLLPALVLKSDDDIIFSADFYTRFNLHSSVKW